jgi:hypothetical protein
MGDDDPFSVAELLELPAEDRQPDGKIRRRRLGKLWLQHLLATPAERVGQLPLPVLARAPVLDSVQDQKATGRHEGQVARLSGRVDCDSR